jgi:hypothetical protein
MHLDFRLPSQRVTVPMRLRESLKHCPIRVSYIKMLTFILKRCSREPVLEILDVRRILGGAVLGKEGH